MKIRFSGMWLIERCYDEKNYSEHSYNQCRPVGIYLKKRVHFRPRSEYASLIHNAEKY